LPLFGLFPRSDPATEERERMNILEEIAAERDYQEEKWGTFPDDHHSNADWRGFIDWRLSEATREDLVEAGALVVAWIESFDRLAILAKAELPLFGLFPRG